MNHNIISKIYEYSTRDYKLAIMIGKIHEHYPTPPRKNNKLIKIFETKVFEKEEEISDYINDQVGKKTSYRKLLKYHFYDLGEDSHITYNEYVKGILSYERDWLRVFNNLYLTYWAF